MKALEKFEGVKVSDISVFLGPGICNIHGHYFIWQVIALGPSHMMASSSAVTTILRESWQWTTHPSFNFNSKLSHLTFLRHYFISAPF
jgi:hypothetical protein